MSTSQQSALCRACGASQSRLTSTINKGFSLTALKNFLRMYSINFLKSTADCSRESAIDGSSRMRRKSSRTLGCGDERKVSTCGRLRLASESANLEEQTLRFCFDGLTMHETDDPLELLWILERAVAFEVGHARLQGRLFGEALSRKGVQTRESKGGRRKEGE